MGFLVKHRDLLKRGLVLCMCLLVFVFALQPRINFHGKGFVGKLQPRERTKLRPEAKVIRVDVPVVAFWLATSAAYFLMFCGQPVMQRVLLVLAPHDVMPQYHRQTFLRPPPVFSH